MAKRFKLKFSLLSFQFCRSNQISPLPKSPLASTLFSPINPKSLEILYPNTFPDPPPTTANHCSSKIMPFSNNEFQSTCNNTQKICNSPVVYESDDNAWPITPRKGHKKKMKKTQRKKKSAKGTRMTISFADSGWFSSEEYEESSTENFDSSCEFSNPAMISRRKEKNGNLKVRRLRRYVSSNNLKSGGGGGGESPVRKSSAFRRMMMTPCAVEGKVKESFAVVKNSEDPYEDFKRSMMEMITAKQMFEAKDLEQLLQCFLSLNARRHHAVIVQAFSKIWETLFL